MNLRGWEGWDARSVVKISSRNDCTGQVRSPGTFFSSSLTSAWWQGPESACYNPPLYPFTEYRPN